MYSTPPDKIMRSTRPFSPSSLENISQNGYNSPVVQSKTAVLSGRVTRTGVWRVAACHTLPAIMFPPLFYLFPRGKARALWRENAKNTLKLLEVHTSKRLIQRLRRALHFLYLYHTLHAVPAQNVDPAGGSYALAALGANELAGGAGPLAARRVGSRLGGPSGSGADDGR